jgi:hypothetical protein
MMARSSFAKVTRGCCCCSRWKNTTAASVDILVDITVSADEVHLICVGEQNNAIAMLINPA